VRTFRSILSAARRAASRVTSRACFGGTGYTFADGTAATTMGCGASKPARLVPDPPAPQPAAAAAAPEPAPWAPTESTSPVANPSSAPAASSWDDWDDEDDSSAPTRSQPPPRAVGPTPQPSEHAAFRNASGVLCIGAVAAAAMEVGLRCTSCGQRVHRFEAHQWEESADYYTFRNYVRTRRLWPRNCTWPASSH
jgi:hypothetical protein